MKNIKVENIKLKINRYTKNEGYTIPKVGVAKQCIFLIENFLENVKK